MRIPRLARFRYVLLVGGTGGVEGALGSLGVVCGVWMLTHNYAPTEARAVLYWAPGDVLRNWILILGGLVQLGGIGVRWPLGREVVATALMLIALWLGIVYVVTNGQALATAVFFWAAVVELWIAARVHTDKDVNGWNRRDPTTDRGRSDRRVTD